jgi:hypothetical protein
VITNRQSDFSGGENRKLLPEFIKANQLTLAQNCVMTAEGLIETRQGKVKVNTDSLGAGNVLSAVRWAKENGTKYLVVQHGTSLFGVTWDGSTPFASFGTAIKTGLTAGAKLRYVVWKDNLICYNSADVAFRWDGTTVTNLAGSPPKFIHLVLYGGRLWGIDVATGYIRFSGLETYDTWDALDLLTARSGDGDKLTALIPVSGGLLACKTKNIFPIYGTNRFDVSMGEAITGIGCMSADAALTGIVMGADNWYLAGLSAVTPFPETHTPLLTNLTFAQKQAVFSAYQSRDRRALYHLPTGETVVIDGKRNAITTWKGLAATCFAMDDSVGDDGRLLMGGTDGHVYMLSGTDDSGTSIETYIKLPYSDHGTGLDKEWRVFWPKVDILDSGDYEIFLRYDVDYASVKGQDTFTGSLPDYLEWGEEDWGSAAWGTGTNSIETPYWMHGVRGEYVSFEIRTNQRIRFRGYESRYNVAGRKS